MSEEIPVATAEWRDHCAVPPAMQIQGGDEPKANVIRIDACIRLRWVCASGHDHRWRLTAWLCNLVKG